MVGHGWVGPPANHNRSATSTEIRGWTFFPRVGVGTYISKRQQAYIYLRTNITYSHLDPMLFNSVKLPIYFLLILTLSTDLTSSMEKDLCCKKTNKQRTFDFNKCILQKFCCSSIHKAHLPQFLTYVPHENLANQTVP